MHITKSRICRLLLVVFLTASTPFFVYASTFSATERFHEIVFRSLEGYLRQEQLTIEIMRNFLHPETIPALLAMMVKIDSADRLAEQPAHETSYAYPLSSDRLRQVIAASLPRQERFVEEIMRSLEQPDAKPVLEAFVKAVNMADEFTSLPSHDGFYSDSEKLFDDKRFSILRRALISHRPKEEPSIDRMIAALKKPEYHAETIAILSLVEALNFWDGSESTTGNPNFERSIFNWVHQLVASGNGNLDCSSLLR